ncbi:MAG: glycosyltransferase family 2 protein [Planctomycetes bacterium]|nr:glycosyltransferase family 2 protein [Planctomycetota bacterium]
MTEERPKVTFGLPVRNGAKAIRRCLDSLLAQDLEGIEILVSDNASTDGTQDIVRSYAARDARIKPLLNEKDVGQIENFNRVVRLGRGEYFRWIGAEDWLEPNYASRCAGVLDQHPEAINVTTFFRIHFDSGESRYAEYRGELLESRKPEERFRRMLWTFHAGDATYEPLYALMRRDVLENTALIRMMVKADRILAAELSLLGPFIQLEECLAHRWKPQGATVHSAKYLKRYRPGNSGELQSNPWRQTRTLVSVVSQAPLSISQRLRCHSATFGFLITESRIHLRNRFRKLRRTLGLTRRNLRVLIEPRDE